MLGRGEWLARLGNRAQEVAEIEQRVAQRRKLPVEHGAHAPRAVGREHHVADAVVVVHDGRTGFRGHVVAEPPLDDLEPGRGAALVVGVEARQAPQVAGVESLRTTGALEASGAPIDRVERGHGVDEILADLPSSRRRVERRRGEGCDDRPVRHAHHVERHVENLAGLGRGEDARNRNGGVSQR